MFRKTLKHPKKPETRRTRKKQEDMSGFYRRMSEPFRPERYYPTHEELKKWNEKYGPSLSSDEQSQLYIKKTSKPYKPKPLPIQDEDDYVPSWKVTLKIEPSVIPTM